jgi:hypothetical protein
MHWMAGFSNYKYDLTMSFAFYPKDVEIDVPKKVFGAWDKQNLLDLSRKSFITLA